MLRIRTPKPGFVDIASECDENGTFEGSFHAIIRLMQKATRERDYHRTHLLTVSLHAFLYYKGGSYPVTSKAGQSVAAALAAQAALLQTVPSVPELQPPEAQTRCAS